MIEGIAFSRCSKETYEKICNYFEDKGFFVGTSTRQYDEGDKCLVINFIRHRVGYTRFIGRLMIDKNIMYIKIKE